MHAGFLAQARADIDTLRAVFDGLDRLEADFAAHWPKLGAQQRGYFTADEDDLIRQFLLSYRNYRLTCYDIIWRYAGYSDVNDAKQQIASFVVGYAAGLKLFSKAMRFVAMGERHPTVREKLNEPDAKFGLEARFFEQVADRLSSLDIAIMRIDSERYWRAQRRAVRELGLTEDADFAWVIEQIRLTRKRLRINTLRMWRTRLWHDWRALWRTVFEPLKSAQYLLQAMVGGALANTRLVLEYRPSVDAAVVAQVRAQALPGDVLLTRIEHKVTTALLPGFWAHAGMYLGAWHDLERLGIAQQPYVQAARAHMLDSNEVYVIEAVSPRTRIVPLATFLEVDHVALLRPTASGAEVRDALAESCGHLGKPYDFDFDFTVSSRIVCTELVYRAYHGRENMRFDLIKRLGRQTIAPDDVAAAALETTRSGAPGLHLKALFLAAADARAHAIAPEQVLASFAKLAG